IIGLAFHSFVRFVRDAMSQNVRVVDGVASVRRIWRTGMTYTLTVQRHVSAEARDGPAISRNLEFNVPNRARFALIDGLRYRFYSLARSELLLSAEPIG